MDETNNVVLDEEIAVPNEIPYAPDAPQTGPISLAGLKTAIDYVLFTVQTLTVYQRARLLSNLPIDGGLGSWDVDQAEHNAKTNKEKAAAFVLRAVYEGAYAPDAPESAYPQEFLNRLKG